MANKNPYSPIVVPSEWNGRPKSFAMQVKQHISDIYLRLRKKLGNIDSSHATPGNLISIDNDWNLTDSGISPLDLVTSQGIEIPDNSDLNDYRSYGVFYTQNAAHTATLSHVPLNTAGIKLIVMPIANENWLLQICIFNLSNLPVYMRAYRNGTWVSWKKNIQEADVANNLTTTDEGYVLDARQGKVLDDEITALSDKNVEYADAIASDMNSINVLSRPYVGRWQGSKTANAPLSFYTGTFITYASSANYETQIAFSNDGRLYIRSKNNGTWGSWQRIPNGVVNDLTSTSTTDALSAAQGKVLNDKMANMPSHKQTTIAQAGTTFTVDNGSRIIIDVLTTTSTLCGTLFIYATNSGAVYCYKNGASGITADTSTANKLKLTPTANCTAYIRIYAGNIS